MINEEMQVIMEQRDAALARVSWLVVLGLTALWDSISVYIGPSPRQREKDMKNYRREKKCPNNPHPHLLQVQQAHALL